MTRRALGLTGILVLACAASPEPSVPPVAPVVAPLPGPAPGRTAEDAELEAELEAGLDEASPPDAEVPGTDEGTAGATP